MKNNLLLLFILCFFLTPFFYAFGFCFPRGDDFDEATRAMFFLDLPGALYETGREWLTWSGRFFYHFLAVFLGKAAENRLLYGLICGIVFSLYGLAVAMFVRPVASRTQAAMLGLAALLTVASAHQSLPDFYLLTDALTICLQGALFLLFCVFIFRLLSRPDRVNKNFWLAFISGSLAIGVYEHSALAVFWSLISLFLTQIAQQNSISAGWQKIRQCKLDKLFLWLGLIFAFSFLAPGNFARGAIRHMSTEQTLLQLGRAPLEWTRIMVDFLTSSWIPAIFCLASLTAIHFPPKNRSPLTAFAAVAGYSLFSLSVICAQALTDAPISSSAKFTASLGFYAAFALAIAIYFLVPFRIGNCFLKILIGSLFCAAILASSNFLTTFANAVNGQMAELGLVMEIRQKYLYERARLEKNSLPEFGILGEIKNPKARIRTLDYTKTFTKVAKIERFVFPVFLKASLAESPEAWPNKWAAWFYGVAGVSARPPNPAQSLNVFEQGEAIQLVLSTIPEQKGISGAWLAFSKGQNPTFNNLWLILKFAGSLEDKIHIIQPMPVTWQRLCPLSLQEWLLEDLLNKSETTADWRTSLCASSFSASPYPLKDGMCAVNLGIAAFRYPIPCFISLDGQTYYRLSPFL